jgi:putative membrane protein
MTMMVKDHVEDVSEFERESASGSDTDVKAWAGRTVPTLRQHLQMAQETATKVGAGGAIGGVGGGAGVGNANTASRANANAGAGNHNAATGRNGNANRRP